MGCLFGKPTCKLEMGRRFCLAGRGEDNDGAPELLGKWRLVWATSPDVLILSPSPYFAA